MNHDAIIVQGDKSKHLKKNKSYRLTSLKNTQINN